MKTKACSKCGEVKEMSEFHRSPTSTDGRTSRCGSCRSEDLRTYSERRHQAEEAALQSGLGFDDSDVDPE